VNGEISALPLEVVRVWLGKYDAGTTVDANYYSGTQVVEFDLTGININAAATINDNLSKWTNLINAKTIDSYAAVLAAEEKVVQVLPGSLEFMVHAPADSADTRHSDHAHTPRRQRPTGRRGSLTFPCWLECMPALSQKSMKDLPVG
jgi:hypothetical protein